MRRAIGVVFGEAGVFELDFRPQFGTEVTQRQQSAGQFMQPTVTQEKFSSGTPVIPPFLTGLCSRIHAAIFSFCAGVMPPMPILGRSLLYVQSHCVANSCASSMLSMMY